MPLIRINENSSSAGGLRRVVDQRDGVTGLRRIDATGNKPDLDSVDGLLKLARQKGLLSEAEDLAEDDGLSTLQRLSSGLGALNPAEAIASAYEGTENFLVAYPKTVLQGIASALTGNDYGEQTKRRYFGKL